MPPLVIDVAFNKPDYSKVRTVGYIGVIRYLSKDPSKNLTPAERDEIHALGLAIGLVWEAGATDWENSTVAQQEAAQAVQEAKALGVPPGICIYTATDAAATLQQVTPGYVAARPIIHGAGYTLGVYGGDTIVDPLVREGVCEFGWQAAAASWGDGRVSSVASLFQRVSKTLPYCGGAYDEDVVLKFPDGLWLPGQSVPPGGGGTGSALPVSPPRSPAWWHHFPMPFHWRIP